MNENDHFELYSGDGTTLSSRNLEKQAGRRPPHSWPIRVEARGGSVYDSPEFSTAARRLNSREEIESYHLDLCASVQSTAGSLGYPVLEYRSDTRPSEYLVFIDRVSSHDHQAALFDQLAKALRAQGLYIDQYFFDGDPRVCWSPGADAPMRLSDLASKHGDHRLLFLGDADRLTNPVTGRLRGWVGAFFAWTDRAILTPLPVSSWGPRERTLASQFIVLPATIEALFSLIEFFGGSKGRESRNGATTFLAAELGANVAPSELVHRLRRDLGSPLFVWLCACSIYPELHWDLTLYLASLASMPGDLVTEENLLRLISLPWFRSGEIPDEIRYELIQQLSSEQEHEVRRAILELLAKNPADEGTFAFDTQRLEIAVNRQVLSRSRKHKRMTRELLRHSSGGSFYRDYVALRSIDSGRRSPLDFLLPPQLRRIGNRNGLSALGLRRLFVRSMTPPIQSAWEVLRNSASSLWTMAAPDRRTRKRLARVVAAGVGSLIVGGLAVWVLHVPESMPNPQLVHFRLELPADFASLTLSDLPLFSPDGSGIVVSGRSARKRQLWIRTVNSAGLRLLSGTEGSRSAVFSPDSRSLAIAIGPNLQRLDLRTGAIQPLSELRGVVTAWSREGVILVTEDNVIKRVMASGGPPKPVTELDASGGELGHHFARFLPDGRHFLFHARATSNKWEDTAVYVGAIGDLKFRKRLLRGTGPAVYAPPGWLLFTRDEVLLAQPFDPSKLEMRGESVRVAGPIGGARVAGLPPFAYSVSETGSLVWLAGSGGGSVSQLTWLDRSGKKLAAVGPRAEIANPVLSPDGKRVLATVRDLVTKARDIWIVDLVRGTNSRFTFGPADNYNPVWSADGVYVVFSSSRQGMMYIYRKRADGVGGEEELLASHVEKSVDSFSVDGKYVLYNQSAPAKPISIWALPLTGERKPMPVVEGAAPANHSQFSPNGRWIAYMSAESGQQPQVFVQTAPGSGGPSGKWQISNAGGAMPQWSLDGKELFFIWRNELMAAPVKSDATTFQHGAPVNLFEFRPGVSQRNYFTPSADGQRFLFAWPEETDETGQIHVILNWPALLKKKQEPMFGGER